jgi:hypothetical protein
MDSEPRGHTIAGTPWEEPRPPHLPDRLTSISPWVLPFLLVAVFQIWVLSLDQPFGTDAGSPLEYWFGIRHEFAEIAGSLIGLALFLRHPDARTTLPQVAKGAVLLVLAQFMGLLELALDPMFVTLAPPSEDLSFFSPLKEAYSIITSLVAVFGIAFIARGLSLARRYESSGPMRGLAAVLVVLTVLSAMASTLGLTTAEFVASPALIGAIIGSLLASFLRTLAFAYLVVVSVGGWLGQDEPRSAWRLAAVGAGLLLVQALVAPFLGIFPLPQDGLLAVLTFIQEGVLVGWVLLVVAFALGLPSTASVAEESEPSTTPDRPAVTTPGSGGG